MREDRPRAEARVTLRDAVLGRIGSERVWRLIRQSSTWVVHLTRTRSDTDRAGSGRAGGHSGVPTIGRHASMGDPYAPIVIRTVEDGGYVPSSSASYGAAGTSGGYSDDRDDSPNASNRKRGGVVGQLFGSSASAPVVLAIGVLCLVVGAAVGVLASPSLATGRWGGVGGIGAAPVAVATAREGIARETVDAVPRVVAPCLLYTSPSPRDKRQSRMPSSA